MSGLKRIVWHWTAGAYGAIDIEREHYHFIVTPEKVVPGKRNPEANRSTRDGDYSAHTRNLNTGSIGIALDAMAGATRYPFDKGKYPITQRQISLLVDLTADLAETYDIPLSRQTILSHAEVEPTLGVKQKGKWDITWIPGMSRPGDAVAVGDRLRDMVRVELMNRQYVPLTWWQRLFMRWKWW